MRMRPHVLPAAICLSGCGGWQSALEPHSTEAQHLAQLFWFFAAVCAVVWLLVCLSLLYLGARPAGEADVPMNDTPEQGRRKTRIVVALTAATGAILAIFALASFYATRGFTWANQHTLTIKVTGNQWWWQVEYENRDPSQIFETANEIRIPVGRPVTFDLTATDVIHSFWVPNLMGKQDLIPGRPNSLTVQADHPGLFRGQCAEYCGLQHAHMAFYVFAEPQPIFEAWRRHQMQSANPPRSGSTNAGRTVFLAGPCAGCHTVRGIGAGGELGPDLTHFGSRATIAAGLLHNSPANLSRWLADPQGIKPGNYMPRVQLSARDRAVLVAYLESLK